MTSARTPTTSLGAASLGAAPLGAASLGAASLGAASLGATSLGATSLGAASLGATSLGATVARVDVGAIAANVALLREGVQVAGQPPRALMAIVKANGYGHGAVAAAIAALAGGADWIGVALPQEAVALRAAGITAPLLCWLWAPTSDIAQALAADVTVGVSSLEQLTAVLAADAGNGKPAHIHLKMDSGLGRGGASRWQWTDLVAAAAAAENRGAVRVTGVMSHLGSAEVLDDPSVAEQLEIFRNAVRVAHTAGLEPEHVHLANSAATLMLPETYFTMVRCGLAIFGLDPLDPHGKSGRHGLKPAMSLRAPLALTKKVPTGHGVSYNFIFRTPRETVLALVPLGYGDGIPRAASGHAEVWIGGRRYPVVGQIAMDQMVIDLGPDPDPALVPGTEVVIFGSGDRGEPTAQDWADAAGTIDYEIVTRISARVGREYVGQDPR
ncbi:alanine racemase [Nakamurella antarctica]|uniref:Alanine racemase n=1 Tax=Nakamurella antarctica TaxID=1902245 RepID=A0A3G8ZXA1_9ACTN|nr:alanine racemase [Nakamurella antarctica]AZI58656.1 alanine racemase [Nakamurella antarctica]